MALGALMNSLQHACARSAVGVWLARKMLNQTTLVLGYHLCPSCHGELNGEDKFAAAVAEHISTFVDVGANVGRWSLTLLSHAPDPTAMKGLAVEPNADLLPQLASNLKAYPNVTLLRCAVGAERGSA